MNLAWRGNASASQKEVVCHVASPPSFYSWVARDNLRRRVSFSLPSTTNKNLTFFFLVKKKGRGRDSFPAKIEESARFHEEYWAHKLIIFLSFSHSRVLVYSHHGNQNSQSLLPRISPHYQDKQKNPFTVVDIRGHNVTPLSFHLG